MNVLRPIKEALSLSEFYPYIKEGKEIHTFDDVPNARYLICLYLDSGETLTYYINYFLIYKNKKLENNIKNINNFKKYIENLYLEENKKELGPLEVIKLIDSTNDKNFIDVGAEEQEKTVSIDTPCIEPETVANDEFVYASLQLEDNLDPSLAACKISSEELTSLFNAIRSRLPKFSQEDINIYVDAAGDKKVLVRWRSKSERGNRYIDQISKCLATFINHQQNQIKQIERKGE